jgi:hypothetical protein
MAELPADIVELLAGPTPVELQSVYVQDVSGVAQLFYVDSLGVARQLSGGSDIVLFGAGSFPITTQSRRLFPYFTPTLGAALGEYAIPANRSGFLRNLRVYHNVPGVGGTTITYTVSVNNVSSLLAVTMAPSAVSGSNLVNTANVVAGQIIKVINTRAVLTTSPANVVVSMEFA